MEKFKRVLEEEANDSSQELDNTSFSTLLNDIGIRANYLTSFKNIRTDCKNLHQEYNVLQQKYDELKSQETNLLFQRNDLLSLLEEKKSLCEIEIAKKRLNALKRLTKLKWLKSSNRIEGFVFNENNGYLEHFSYENTDPSIMTKVRRGMHQALDYNFHNHCVF
ncbi:uncharacterized protein LOC135845660 [Planococcus citri]|uniref:uncharacterized protein LOC135845660 n=1 Tax=Planococcus citri TaxID=170843 RepID=UPI0031F7D027